ETPAIRRGARPPKVDARVRELRRANGRARTPWTSLRARVEDPSRQWKIPGSELRLGVLAVPRRRGDLPRCVGDGRVGGNQAWPKAGTTTICYASSMNMPSNI